MVIRHTPRKTRTRLITKFMTLTRKKNLIELNRVLDFPTISVQPTLLLRFHYSSLKTLLWNTVMIKAPPMKYCDDQVLNPLIWNTVMTPTIRQHLNYFKKHDYYKHVNLEAHKGNALEPLTTGRRRTNTPSPTVRSASRPPLAHTLTSKSPFRPSTLVWPRQRSLLCLLLLVRLGGYIVNSLYCYSYRLIGKLTAFLQLQEFRLRNPPVDIQLGLLIHNTDRLYWYIDSK